MDETELAKTELDSAAGEDWSFWRAFAGQELFLLLAEEAAGGALCPRVFDLSEGQMVLVFDREERMAAFSPVPVPYAALPGRVVAQLAAGQGLSLGLNLGSGAASERLLPPEALAWLVETLAVAPMVAAELPELVRPPLLDARALFVVEAAVAAAGFAGEAILAGVVWEGGRQGHLLAFPGLAAADQPRVAQAVAEALALSELEGAALDVAFPAVGARLTESLRRVGRRYRPEPLAEAALRQPKGPGMDPEKPPVLK